MCEFGAFKITNHSISETLLLEVFNITQNFFTTSASARKDLEKYNGSLVHDGSAFSKDNPQLVFDHKLLYYNLKKVLL